MIMLINMSKPLIYFILFKHSNQNFNKYNKNLITNFLMFLYIIILLMLNFKCNINMYKCFNFNNMPTILFFTQLN